MCDSIPSSRSSFPMPLCKASLNANVTIPSARSSVAGRGKSVCIVRRSGAPESVVFQKAACFWGELSCRPWLLLNSRSLWKMNQVLRLTDEHSLHASTSATRCNDVIFHVCRSPAHRVHRVIFFEAPWVCCVAARYPSAILSHPFERHA